MGYKIVASDLDGTLFNRKGEISKENYDAIKTMYEMGIHFVPTSGRSYGEMPKVLKENPYIRYYIGSDGATIYDKKTDTTYSTTLPKEQAHKILDKIYSYSINMMVHANNCSYVDADTHTADSYREHNCSENWIKFIFETNEAVPHFKKFTYDTDIEMFCIFFKNYDELLDCKEYFSNNPELLTAQSHKYNFEIFSKNSGKGNAILKLANILGIDKNDTIAVGDSTNDFTMIEKAGLGLAMQNAVDELKAIADTVICSNEQHSAKYILENYLK